MKVLLLKSCVVGANKIGQKGQTVEVESDVAKQLMAANAAAKPGTDEAKEASKAALAEKKAQESQQLADEEAKKKLEDDEPES